MEYISMRPAIDVDELIVLEDDKEPPTERRPDLAAWWAGAMKQLPEVQKRDQKDCKRA